MSSKPVYKRVLLKFSGEALGGAGGRGIDFDIVRSVAEIVKKCTAAGVQVGIVIGGGNFWRGLGKGDEMDRSRADQIGMLATAMNCMAFSDVLTQMGVPSAVVSPISIPAMVETYTTVNARRYLDEGKVVLFACGTGCTHVSTDTAAVLRAVEIKADALLMAKNVDGLYSADPRKVPDAVKYDRITYREVIAKGLAAMDTTATAMAMENGLITELFALHSPENIWRAVCGEDIGTRIEC